MKSFNQERGFTLLELTVVSAIVVVLAAVVLANYRGGEKQFALTRSAHKLAQYLRQIEETAVSSKRTPPQFGEEVFPRGGYGLYFELDSDHPQGCYIISFADCDGESDYDSWGGATDCGSALPGPPPGIGNSRDETLEELSLEEGIKITALQVNSSPVASFSVTFIPPDPTVIINRSLDNTSAEITLEDDLKVSINKVGLIEITR